MEFKDKIVLHCFREVKCQISTRWFMIVSQEGGVWIYISIDFNSFYGSSEGNWVVAEERGSIVKCRKTSFKVERFLKIP